MMLRWVAIYADNPQREAIVETTGDKTVDLSLFQRAAASRELFGRPVNGMWLLALDTEQEDVLATFGTIPAPIAARATERTMRL